MGTDAVQVWRIGPPLPDPGPLEELLDEEERARASSIRSASARARFVTARAAARTVLGGVLDRDPRGLRFARRCANCGADDHGKPYLPDGRGVDFSIAHSGGVVLVGVARGRAIGVDVERLRETTDVEALARRALSPDERHELENLEPGARRGAFFRAWTRKEAYLKARGLGVAGGLDRWTVAPDGSVSAVASDRGDAAGWHVESLDVAPGYAGAVACDARFDPCLERLDLR